MHVGPWLGLAIDGDLLLLLGAVTTIQPVRATRYQLAIPALYRVGDNGKWKRGLTRNISDTGICFEAAETIPTETLVELTFYLAEPLGNLPPGQLTCVGKIVRQPVPSEATPFPAAAKFLEICSAAAARA